MRSGISWNRYRQLRKFFCLSETFPEDIVQEGPRKGKTISKTHMVGVVLVKRNQEKKKLCLKVKSERLRMLATGLFWNTSPQKNLQQQNHAKHPSSAGNLAQAQKKK
jgi:hypothetical protein